MMCGLNVHLDSGKREGKKSDLRDIQPTQGPEAFPGRCGNRNVKGRRRRKQTSKTAPSRLKTCHV